MINESDVIWDFEGSEQCDPYGHLADGTTVTREKDGTLKAWNQITLRDPLSGSRRQRAIIAEMRNA